MISIKIALLCLVGLIVASGTMIPHIGYAVGRPLPIYNVSINAGPKEKWEKIVPDFVPVLDSFVKDWKTLIPLPYFIY